MNPPDSNGVRKNRTGLIFKKLSEQIYANKTRRYGSEELQNIFNTPNDFIENIKDGKECTVCGTSSKKIIAWEFANENMGDICESCESLFNIGKKIGRIGE
jgi:CRISPR/Cas system-associated protein Cas10 (large subunit of type III CRISPR-Cas system)